MESRSTENRIAGLYRLVGRGEGIPGGVRLLLTRALAGARAALLPCATPRAPFRNCPARYSFPDFNIKEGRHVPKGIR